MPIRKSLDCFCTTAAMNGQEPWCPPCIVAVATKLRRDHPDSLSIALLRRRIPGITGHEAALLCEATKLVLTGSPAHAANRHARYVILEQKAGPPRKAGRTAGPKPDHLSKPASSPRQVDDGQQFGSRASRSTPNMWEETRTKSSQTVYHTRG